MAPDALVVKRVERARSLVRKELLFLDLTNRTDQSTSKGILSRGLSPADIVARIRGSIPNREIDAQPNPNPRVEAEEYESGDWERIVDRNSPSRTETVRFASDWKENVEKRALPPKVVERSVQTQPPKTAISNINDKSVKPAAPIVIYRGQKSQVSVAVGNSEKVPAKRVHVRSFSPIRPNETVVNSNPPKHVKLPLGSEEIVENDASECTSDVPIGPVIVPMPAVSTTPTKKEVVSEANLPTQIDESLNQTTTPPIQNNHQRLSSVSSEKMISPVAKPKSRLQAYGSPRNTSPLAARNRETKSESPQPQRKVRAISSPSTTAKPGSTLAAYKPPERRNQFNPSTTPAATVQKTRSGLTMRDKRADEELARQLEANDRRIQKALDRVYREKAEMEKKAKAARAKKLQVRSRFMDAFKSAKNSPVPTSRVRSALPPPSSSSTSKQKKTPVKIAPVSKGLAVERELLDTFQATFGHNIFDSFLDEERFEQILRASQQLSLAQARRERDGVLATVSHEHAIDEGKESSPSGTSRFREDTPGESPKTYDPGDDTARNHGHVKITEEADEHIAGGFHVFVDSAISPSQRSQRSFTKQRSSLGSQSSMADAKEKISASIPPNHDVDLESSTPNREGNHKSSTSSMRTRKLSEKSARIDRAFMLLRELEVQLADEVGQKKSRIPDRISTQPSMQTGKSEHDSLDVVSSNVRAALQRDRLLAHSESVSQRSSLRDSIDTDSVIRISDLGSLHVLDVPIKPISGRKLLSLSGESIQSILRGRKAWYQYLNQRLSGGIDGDSSICDWFEIDGDNVYETGSPWDALESIADDLFMEAFDTVVDETLSTLDTLVNRLVESELLGLSNDDESQPDFAPFVP
ncbi:hypothetical protein BJ742DRAFT_793690 [Cladochytrium replicatum]|nr:hypothetical protein BJ742DRAFT_793690 [Cladochytrium replicatum]